MGVTENDRLGGVSLAEAVMRRGVVAEFHVVGLEAGADVGVAALIEVAASTRVGAGTLARESLCGVVYARAAVATQVRNAAARHLCNGHSE